MRGAESGADCRGHGELGGDGSVDGTACTGEDKESAADDGNGGADEGEWDECDEGDGGEACEWDGDAGTD